MVVLFYFCQEVVDLLVRYVPRIVEVDGRLVLRWNVSVVDGIFRVGHCKVLAYDFYIGVDKRVKGLVCICRPSYRSLLDLWLNWGYEMEYVNRLRFVAVEFRIGRMEHGGKWFL